MMRIEERVPPGSRRVGWDVLETAESELGFGVVWVLGVLRHRSAEAWRPPLRGMRPI